MGGTGNVRALTLLLFVLLATSNCYSQTYTQRGFLETKNTFYPQEAPNDRAHTVGESLFRYEGFLSPTSSVQLAGALDFRIDTHRQVDRDFQVSWQDREIRRPLGEIRRLSATYHKGPLTFEMGKHFIRWGKSDIVTPTDRFAPRDFLAVVDNDFLAVTAARFNFEKGTNTIEAVWSPRFTPSRIPIPNQRWSVSPELPPGITLRHAGAAFPGGPQSGVRWNHAAAGGGPDRGLATPLLGRAGYTIDATGNIVFEAAVRQNGEGVWCKSEYSHLLSLHGRATLNVTLISGNTGDFLGQYHRNSHAMIVVRYSF